MKTASRRSASTNAMAAPMIHIMSTLYTLRPICFESLSAGIETKCDYRNKTHFMNLMRFTLFL